MSTPPFVPPAFSGRFGVARRDITPDIRIYARNWGAAASDTAESIHRPLTLTVLALQETKSDDPLLVILSLDLGWWRARDEEIALADAVMAAGVLPGRFIISLSHTHSGPIFCPRESGQLGGEHIAPYLAMLCATITEAITAALVSSTPGLFETATGTCPLATHRDLPDPAADRFLVGWNPAARPDQTLLVGRITRPDGSCLATLVNYACHPTILAWENRTISPDFVGAMREVVEADTASPCLFLQGASGELSPRHQYVGDLAVPERAGRCLGHSVLSLLYHMLEPACELVYEGCRESGAPLAVWDVKKRASLPGSITTRDVTVPLPIKADLPLSAEFTTAIATTEDRVLRERLQRKSLIREAIGDASEYPTTGWLWRCGSILIVAVPNELYASFQETVRELAGDLPVFVVTLANGGRGYLVPASYYDLDIYPMWQSPFARGAFEQLVSAVSAEVVRLRDL